MKVLITGATGQTGAWLCHYLIDNRPDVEIHCTKRWRSDMSNTGYFKNKVHWHLVDLIEENSVRELIADVRPDKIFHYAAESYVKQSWDEPWKYTEQNVKPIINIQNAILGVNNIRSYDARHRRLIYNPKVFVALSSEQYGLVKHGTMITEETLIAPASPYGATKVMCENLCEIAWRSYGMNFLRIRTFNNESPFRGEIFVTANFIKQVVMMEKGLQDKVLYVGNIDSVRDWTDSRDQVRAAWLATEKCDPNEVYQICSGKAYTIRKFIEKIQEIAKVEFEVKVDPNRIRPNDVTWLLGSPSKFKEVTGWEPEYDFMDQTVPEMMKYWRSKILLPSS